MHWVLVLIIINGGVAENSVITMGRFPTMESCNASKTQLNDELDNGQYRAHCVKD